MRAYRNLRPTDLFLVRVWREDARDDGDESVSGGGSSKTEWLGKVQRVVDGESHQFSSLQDLLDLLQTMLSDNERR